MSLLSQFTYYLKWKIIFLTVVTSIKHIKIPHLMKNATVNFCSLLSFCRARLSPNYEIQKYIHGY